ncbi:MAG TPA: lipopolysaccharide transport periplasmic protein LptA [Malonomonas sp.]
MIRLVWLVVIVVLFFPFTGFSADEQLPKPSSLPVEVTARNLEALKLQRQVIFTGEVVAKQGDITLYCDKLTVFSLPEADQVERMEAFGNVRVVQLDRTATAEQAIYRQQAGTLVLIGNAKVHQGQNQVAGDEITVYLQEDRSVVKSKETGRVRAVLFPEQKKGKQ